MMKKFITLALIIGTTTFIQAQSNLVFNQVLNFNIGTRESVTVPEGKVWKLESGISQGDVLISSINQEYGNNLDSSNMDPFSLQVYNMPMWLGQGTTLTLINGSFNFLWDRPLTTGILTLTTIIVLWQIYKSFKAS